MAAIQGSGAIFALPHSRARGCPWPRCCASSPGCGPGWSTAPGWTWCRSV